MTILKITYREWKRIISLPVFYWLLLILPPLLFFFYAFIYEKEKVSDLPIAIWDENNSTISRQLTYMLEQTECIKITHQIKNISELEKLIKKGEVMGAVHFPINMDANLMSNIPVTVTLYTNASALIPAKLIYKNAAQVIIMGGSGVMLEKFVKEGMNYNKAMALVQPIVLHTYPLYNPEYNYLHYLVPGLITVVLQMLIIMVGVLIFNYEYKTNTVDELITTSNRSSINIIAGKTLAHLTVAWVNFILVAGIIFPIFGLNYQGVMFNFFILFTFLVLACIGVGFLISLIFKDVMMSTDIALFYTSPAFVFSGYTFPRWAMPWYDNFYAYIMPYSSFLDGFIKVFNMKLPLKYALPEIGILLIFIVVSFSASYLLLKRLIKKSIMSA